MSSIALYSVFGYDLTSMVLRVSILKRVGNEKYTTANKAESDSDIKEGDVTKNDKEYVRIQVAPAYSG